MADDNQMKQFAPVLIGAGLLASVLWFGKGGSRSFGDIHNPLLAPARIYRPEILKPSTAAIADYANKLVSFRGPLLRGDSTFTELSAWVAKMKPSYYQDEETRKPELWQEIARIVKIPWAESSYPAPGGS